MIPMDPKKAQKLGQAWGEVLTDSVFGIVDTVKNAPAQRAANNQKILNKNKITEINNQITRNNNLLREQAMREIAAEQEADMLARMTPAQRAAFKQAKIDAEQTRKRSERLARERADERSQIFWACAIVFLGLTAMIYLGLFVFGVIISGSDYQTYHSLAQIVPGLKSVVGR